MMTHDSSIDYFLLKTGEIIITISQTPFIKNMDCSTAGKKNVLPDVILQDNFKDSVTFSY